MKKIKYLVDILIIAIVLFLLIGVPFIVYSSNNKTNDTVNASASILLPDIPSGEFVILINESKHIDTLDKWEAFFKNDEENIVVIFEDIKCMYAKGDEQAKLLAIRYQAYLPENQMTISDINPILLASKVENGYLDIAIFSIEMANYLNLKDQISGVKKILIKGENNEKN